MREGANRFYNSIDGAAKLSDKQLIGLFAYYLTVEMEEGFATAKAIDECFRACDLAVPSRTAQYLSEGMDEGDFVKAPRGYKLQRHCREELSEKLGAKRRVVRANVELRKLEGKLRSGSTKEFLKEMIDCFEAGANRATIVMCWILALDHLIDYVMKHYLTELNSTLAKNTDKRVKLTSVTVRDDFSDIPEKKLIEFFRTAGAISNNVRQILEEKLNTRNSCAHPSGVSIKASKVVEFVDDLIENVVLKYKI